MLAHIGELQRGADTYVEYRHLFEQEPDDFSVVASVRAQAEGKHQVGAGLGASHEHEKPPLVARHHCIVTGVSMDGWMVLLSQLRSRERARDVLKHQVSGPEGLTQRPVYRA